MGTAECREWRMKWGTEADGGIERNHDIDFAFGIRSRRLETRVLGFPRGAVVRISLRMSVAFVSFCNKIL